MHGWLGLIVMAIIARVVLPLLDGRHIDDDPPKKRKPSRYHR